MRIRRARAGAAVIAVVAWLVRVTPAATAEHVLLSFFSPELQLSESQRARLDSGEALAKTLPARHHELAVFAAGLTSATPDMVVRAVEDIARLKRSSYVPQIGRFSNPPRLSDLDSLTLDRGDAEAIKDCRPGRCDLKLSAAEIERLQHVIAGGGGWVQPLQREFRRVILDRVQRYVRDGERGIGPFDGPDPAHVFSLLLAHSVCMTMHAPNLVAYLDRYPAARPRGADAFLYWSKETVARHPIVSVTHVVIERGSRYPGDRAEVRVVSRDVFSTRYISGAAAMTVLLRADGSPPRRYLAYVNHTWVDSLFWLWRPIVEHRVRTGAAKAFAEARARIEATD